MRGNKLGEYLIVGESFGAEEARQGKAFVGASGKELERMLCEAGIDPENCLFTNVINERPPSNDMRQFFHKGTKAASYKGLYPKENVLEGIRKLKETIRKMPRLKLIIGFGNYTLWALTRNCFRIGNSSGWKVPVGIGDYRGSMLFTEDGIPFLPTYHPAAVLRNWAWRYLVIHDISSRLPKIDNWADRPRDFITRPTFREVEEWLSSIREGQEVAADIEVRDKHIACIGLSADPSSAICIPFMQVGDLNYWQEDEEKRIIGLLRNIMKKCKIIGHNFLFDSQYIAFYWQVLPNIYCDTMIAHHLLYPGTPLSLNYISSLYNEWHAYWKDEGKLWTPDIDERQLWEYNCRDVVATLEASRVLLEQVERAQMQELHEVQTRQLHVMLKMMLRGILVDEEVKKGMLGELIEASSQIANSLERMLPTDVYERPKRAAPWYRSPKQLKEIFYDVLGCRPKSRGRKEDGSPRLSVDDEALEALKLENPELGTLIERLQQLRSLSVFSSFAKMKVGFDGRMRSSFSPTTETFRWRSSEDVFGTGRNLQNLPKGQE